MINPIIYCKFIKVFGNFQKRKYDNLQLKCTGDGQQAWQHVAEEKKIKSTYEFTKLPVIHFWKLWDDSVRKCFIGGLGEKMF